MNLQESAIWKLKRKGIRARRGIIGKNENNDEKSDNYDI